MSNSSKKWLKRHVKDPFVQRAQKDGYRSRAAYKLIELHQKYKIFKPGDCVIDLGATPGGWSQVASSIVGSAGKVVAIDLLPMDPIADVVFINNDFNSKQGILALQDALAGTPVNVIISDMAPNMTGNSTVDQLRSLELIRLTLQFSLSTLSASGMLLVKMFHGIGTEQMLADLKQSFTKVMIKKPKASRDSSREVYVLCIGIKA